MIKKIAHVGIAVESIAVMADFYRLLGLEMSSVETIEDQGVKAAMLQVGDSALELIEPIGEESALARFIGRRGEGLHHITLEVDDLESALSTLREENIKLIDEKPRKGADGHWIAFVHPHSTGGVLIELSQTPDPEEDFE